MTADSLEAEIKGLVARTMAVRPEQLTPDTRLLQDIGVDGDDGWELMAAHKERFGVDLSQFRPDLHFGPEGDGFVLLWRRLLGLEPSRFIPITVGDLVAAAQSGRWLTDQGEVRGRGPVQNGHGDEERSAVQVPLPQHRGRPPSGDRIGH